MAQQVQLCYTVHPHTGSVLTLDLDVLSVRGAAEPDEVQVFPSLRHDFLDGSISEEIAGGRRNIELVLSVVTSALNRRKLVQFWLDPDRTIKSLAGKPGSFGASAGTGGSLTNVEHFYSVCAVDAVGRSEHATVATETPDANDKVTLTWTAVTNARCYVIFRKVTGGNWWIIDYSTANSYVDTGDIAAGSGLQDLGSTNESILPQVVTEIHVVRDSDSLISTWNSGFEGARSYTLRFNEASIFDNFPV